MLLDTHIEDEGRLKLKRGIDEQLDEVSDTLDEALDKMNSLASEVASGTNFFGLSIATFL